MEVNVGTTSSMTGAGTFWLVALLPMRRDVDLSHRKKSVAETIHHVPPAVWMSPRPPFQLRVEGISTRLRRRLRRLRRRPKRFTLAIAAIAATGASTAETAARTVGTVVNMHDSTATVEVPDWGCEMSGFSNAGQRSTESRGLAH